MYKEDGYTSDSDSSATWCIHQQSNLYVYNVFKYNSPVYNCTYVQHAQRVHELVLHLKV